MEHEFNPDDEFYCTNLKEHVTVWDCEKGNAGNGPPACLNCITGNEKLIELHSYNHRKDLKPQKRNYNKKPKIEKAKTDNEKCDNYENNSLKICIDFRHSTVLFSQIRNLARKNFREIDKQIMYMLSTWKD